MMRIARTSQTAALLLLLPVAIGAQSSLQLELTPGVAYYSPLSDVGAAAPSGGIWYLRLDRIDPTASLEVSARLSRPGSPLSARVRGLVALASEAAGNFSCYPGLACPEVLMNITAEATIWAAVADLVFSPIESAVLPFAALGAGMKRYSFSWPDAAVLVDGGDYAESALALHAGIGFELPLAGAPLRLEVSDYWSGEGIGLQGTDNDQVSQPRRNAQHDLVISVGWSVLRF